MVKILVDDAFMAEFDKAFDSSIGQANYNIMFDTNQDGVIDILDAVWFSKHRNQEVELPWVDPTVPVPIFVSTAEVIDPATRQLLRGIHEIFRTLTKSQMEYLAQLLTPLNTIAALIRNVPGGGAGAVLPMANTMTIDNMNLSMDTFTAVFSYLNGRTPEIPQQETM